jgi:HSP20 family protein
LSLMEKKALVEELIGMKQRMEGLYAESTGKRERKPEPQDESPAWQPLVDVYESDAAWMAVADLPGVLEEKLEVKVEGSDLVIQGTRSGLVKDAGQGKIVQSERPQGRFARKLVLPDGLAMDLVKAELNRGVLIVEIAKNVDAGRKIPVRRE